MKTLLIALAAVATVCAHVDLLSPPEGFRTTVFAHLEDAAGLASGGASLFVSSCETGYVIAYVDGDRDGVAENHFKIGGSLKCPSGLAYHNGDLFVAESHRISRIRSVESFLGQEEFKFETVVDFGGKADKIQRNLAVSPTTERLFVGTATSIDWPKCDMGDCKENGMITSYELDGTNEVVEAEGVNVVAGMAFHPETGELWFTDNSPEAPPRSKEASVDELNILTASGQDFGYPYCTGDTKTRGYKSDNWPPGAFATGCDAFEAPEHEFCFAADVAGAAFVNSKTIPIKYHGLFIAQAGGPGTKKPRGSALVYYDNGEVKDFVSFALKNPTCVKNNKHAKKGEKENCYIPCNSDAQCLGHARCNPAVGKDEHERFCSGWASPRSVAQLYDGSIVMSDPATDAVYRFSYEPDYVEEIHPTVVPLLIVCFFALAFMALYAVFRMQTNDVIPIPVYSKTGEVVYVIPAQ